MRTCDGVRSLLAIYAGDDLPERQASGVAEHLTCCATCYQEFTEYKTLLASALAVLPQEAMPVAVRRRIVAAAAGNARRSTWQGLGRFLPEIPAMRLAGAVATLAILVVVALPMAGREPSKRSWVESVTKIDVVQDGGVVRLAWNDGERETYTVYKSDNPREFSRAEAHVVQGNVWTDETPETSPVVFYRID